MTRASLAAAVLVLGLLLAAFGCGGEELVVGPRDEGESRNVVQGGAQDAQALRDILQAGGVPALDDLDMLGFFAEHAIDLPAADCGSPVCVHPMLAVAPRFDEGNWTMAFVAANTSVDPSAAARPRHVIVVLAWTNLNLHHDVWPTVRAALMSELDEDERVSVYRSLHDLEPIVLTQAPADLPDSVFAPDGSTADPLRLLLSTLEHIPAEGLQRFEQRVLLFTDGPGLVPHYDADERAVGETFGELQVPISVFRLDPTNRFGALLANASQGNLYGVSVGTDLQNAVDAEVATAFVPLAHDFELRVEAAPSYQVGDVHGAPRVQRDGALAVLHTATLYAGARTGASDVEGGRRGGGGGWFVELEAESPVGEAPEQMADSARISWSYTAHDGSTHGGERTLATPLGVGNNPPPDAPYFSDPARAKPFMMLNFFMALQTTVELFADGRCADAQLVLPMMQASYDYWHEVYDDPDIDADMLLLEQLHGNVAERCQEPPTEDFVPDVSFSCFFF